MRDNRGAMPVLGKDVDFRSVAHEKTTQSLEDTNINVFSTV